MKPMLIQTDSPLYYYGKKNGIINGPNPKLSGDYSNLTGNCSNIYGKCTDDLYGDCSNLKGDIYNVYGDCSNLSGDIDKCKITQEEREQGIFVDTLIK